MEGQERRLRILLDLEGENKLWFQGLMSPQVLEMVFLRSLIMISRIAAYSPFIHSDSGLNLLPWGLDLEALLVNLQLTPLS